MGIMHDHVLVALRVVEALDLSTALHARAEWWIDQTYFCSNPPGNYMQIVGCLEKNLGPLLVPNPNDLESLSGVSQ